MPKTISEVLTDLKKPVDPSLVKQRDGYRDRNGNVHKLDYVEWHVVADILDEKCPDWTHKVISVSEIEGWLVVLVEITIMGITRQGMGTGTASSEMGIKKAESDALKRAAVKFGVARELYKKEADVIEREDYQGGGSYGGSSAPFDPKPRSEMDRVSPKQIGLMRALAGEKNTDPDTESRELFQLSADLINKKAASKLIDHLKEMKPKAGAMDRDPNLDYKPKGQDDDIPF